VHRGSDRGSSGVTLDRDQESISLARLASSFIVRHLNSKSRQVRTKACFIVKDGGGQKLAYVYLKEEPGRRSAAKLLNKDEVRRIAANVAKLPELQRSPVMMRPCATCFEFNVVMLIPLQSSL
jgi:DNA-directed RNA polymerase specialized sigma24 family protein